MFPISDMCFPTMILAYYSIVSLHDKYNDHNSQRIAIASVIGVS